MQQIPIPNQLWVVLKEINATESTKLDEAEDQTHRYGADLRKRYSLTDLRVLPWSR